MISSADRSVRAGNSAKLSLNLTGPATCRAELAGRRAIRSVARPGWIRFAFAIRRNAKTGKYPVKVACDRTAETYKLTVKGKRNGTTKVVEHINGLSGLYPVPPVVPPTTPNTSTMNPPATTDYDAMAENFYQEYKRSALGTGQCVDYAIQRREDIFRALTYPQLLQYVTYGGVRPPLPTQGYTWMQFAIQNGLRTDNIPRVGAIMVIAANTPYTGPSGHLGYVEAVNPDGSVTFSSMNWTGGLGVVVTDTFPASVVTDPAIKFIG